MEEFQSTPSARRATLTPKGGNRRARNFNPRPPRGGRLDADGDHPRHAHYFNPRPPRGGRRTVVVGALTFFIFQSTPSARRATDLRPDARARVGISIHALREEGDMQRVSTAEDDFQISIHALREEGDASFMTCWSVQENFNPRPPRGGRQQKRRKNPPRLFHYTHLCTI